MPDGYVVDILGPYHANKNDAEILREILDKNEDFKSLLEDGDVLILDREFRDVVGDLETKGFKVLMPSLKGKRNQLSTEEANHSRRVTAIRWPVEAKNTNCCTISLITSYWKKRQLTVK